MAFKTYIPRAVDVADVAHKYLTRWQAQLQTNLTTDQITCLIALIAALADFLACVRKPAPSP